VAVGDSFADRVRKQQNDAFLTEADGNPLLCLAEGLKLFAYYGCKKLGSDGESHGIVFVETVQIPEALVDYDKDFLIKLGWYHDGELAAYVFEPSEGSTLDEV
jgi:hypothetical protein